MARGANGVPAAALKSGRLVAAAARSAENSARIPLARRRSSTEYDVDIHSNSAKEWIGLRRPDGRAPAIGTPPVAFDESRAAAAAARGETRGVATSTATAPV